MKPSILPTVLLLALLYTGCRPEVSSSTVENTGEISLFGKGVISTGLYERDIAIDPQGRGIIYTLGDYRQLRRCLVSSRQVGGKWSTPQILNISGIYQDIEPFLAENGQRLYFAYDRPLPVDDEAGDYNIWYSDRTSGGWSSPTPLDSLINTSGNEFYPSVSLTGNLYFTATRPDGVGREDIYISRSVNGVLQPPEVLDTTINTQYYEFNAYVNPEETLLIFSSYGREDDLGGGDLYFSTKDEHGRWRPAEHMGPLVNSDKLDYCPFVDRESGYFYFTSERTRAPEGRLNNVDQLVDFAESSGNGMGDIYWIRLEAIGL